MIFGYNSEVREGDTVYHVQSEARSPAAKANAALVGELIRCELLLETQVFLGGRCIATRSMASPQADVKAAQESLRLQHRSVLECIRRGELELSPALAGSTTAPAAEREETPDGRGFRLRCTAAQRDASGVLVMHFQLTESAVPKPGVKLRCFLAEANSVLASELLSEPTSNDEGMVELRIAGALPRDPELQIELEGGRHRTMHRFQLTSPANR